MKFSITPLVGQTLYREKICPAMRRDKIKFLQAMTAIAFCMVLVRPVLPGNAFAASKPNIILIYTDDVGFGDISCHGAKGIRTPNIDTLAAQGIDFTNAHATASVSSPSRFSILTGQYAWRPPALSTTILDWNAKLTINVNQPTLGKILISAGYATAAIGKWHLGISSGTASSVINYNKELTPGPNEIGFDFSFIYPATNDRVPCIFIQNHWMHNADSTDTITTGVQGTEPTGVTNPELLIYPYSSGHNGTIVFELGTLGISRIGFMNGGQKARFKDETMVDTLLAQTVSFIEQHTGGPFFVYFAPPNIHVPRYPHARFRGTSACGYRGESMHELDWSVGQIVATLKRLNLYDSTIIIFSSDNGPVLDDGYADSAVQKASAVGHNPAGIYRGGKYSLYEGGTRLPFIVRWPGKIPAGSVSGVLVGQTDLLATFAAITGQIIPGGYIIDSKNMLPTLLSGGKDTVRTSFVEQQNGATNLAVISGDWKLIVTSGSADQLYNLRTDPSEATNVASSNAAKVTQLKALLDTIKNQPAVGVRSDVPIKGHSAAFCRKTGDRTVRMIKEMLPAFTSVSVCDCAGRTVYSSATPVITVRLEQAGVYFVKARSGSAILTQKIVIE